MIVVALVDKCCSCYDRNNIAVTNENRLQYVMMLTQAHCLAGAEESVLYVTSTYSTFLPSSTLARS